MCPEGSYGGATTAGAGAACRPVQRARRPGFTLGRGTVGRLLAVPARLLHPWRRRAARETLRTRALRSILVVCHGNICRSPVAAALLRQALGPAGINRAGTASSRPT